MTKRRRQGWMLFLAGLLLLAGAWLLLKLLPPAPQAAEEALAEAQA